LDYIVGNFNFFTNSSGHPDHNVAIALQFFAIAIIFTFDNFMTDKRKSSKMTATTCLRRFVKTATNKMRCPIFTLDWTPEGRRLITGQRPVLNFTPRGEVVPQE
jgi:hypothetical protein